MARVLLIEDEVLVAMHIEDVLTDSGCEVVALATDLRQAVTLARTVDIDFAVLDINLGGEQSFPAAQVLRERGVPFLFISGYSSGGIAEDYRNELRLRKPLRTPELVEAIERLQAPC